MCDNSERSSRGIVQAVVGDNRCVNAMGGQMKKISAMHCNQ